MITQKTINLVKKHEGFRAKPYKCTAGKITIGYGRNIEDNGVTEKEAELMLENDMAWAAKDALYLFPNMESLNEARQSVLINMAFNLGKVRLSGFRKFREAVEKRDFPAAAKEMLDSAWSTQVKGRAIELAKMMETGEF